MNLVEKIKVTLLSIFNVLFIATFSYILINATLFPNQYIAKMNAWIVAIISIVLFFILFGCYDVLKKLSEKSLIVISCVNFLIFIGLQMFFFKYFQVIPSWDVGVIYNEALTHQEYIGSLSSYFTERYPNNIPMLLVEIYGIRILSFFGVENFYKAFTALNAVVVLCSMVGLYYLSYRRLGLVASTWGSLFMLLVTPLYVYTPIFYTDTLVMPFVIFGILLYDIFYHSKDRIRYLWLVILSVLLAIGVLFKTNAIIFVIAMVIHYLMTRSYKQWFIFLSVFIIPFVMINCIYQHLVTPLYPVEKSELGFPATHWVMMGASDKGHYYGGYYGEDVMFTDSLKVVQGLSNKEITKIHLGIIKERLTENGLQGFIKHINKKLNYTWAEGTYFAPNKLSRQPLEANPYAKYIYGESSSVFVYFCQAVQLNILGLLVFAGFKLFNKKTVFEIVLSITLFGTFLFLLIWETRSRYLVLMLPVMMAMCTYAMCDKGREVKG